MRWFYVEPIMLMTILSTSLLLLVVQSLVYERKCTELYSDCSFLHSKVNNSEGQSQRITVQSRSDMILTFNIILSFVTPIVSTFIFGLQIDNGKYKISFVLPLLGCLFGNLFLMAIATFHLKLEFVYLASFLTFLFGGHIVVILASFSYITTNTQHFSTRVIIGEMMIVVGTFIGNSLGGYFADHDLLLVAFLVSLFFFSVSLLIALFGAPEDPYYQFCPPETNLLTHELKRLFVFVREKHPRGKFIISYLIIYSLIIFITHGFFAISYLYMVNSPFLMTNQLYGLVTSLIGIGGVTLGVIGAYVFIGHCKMLESTFCCLASFLTLVGFLLLALGYTHAYVFIGALLISSLRTLSAILKSMLAKTVRIEERGRLFSIVLQCQNIVTVVSGTVSFVIYNALLSKNSKAICYLFFGLSFVVFAFFISHRVYEHRESFVLDDFEE